MGPGRSPDGQTAVAFCSIECFQNASGCSILVLWSALQIAMSGKMKANPGSGGIWYLLATYGVTP